MLNFDELETLRSVARTGSFSAAGRELYLTQPAISQRVRHVEQVLGVEIFERTSDSRKLRLTEAGQRVVDFAADTMGAYNDLRLGLFPPTETYSPVTVGCAGLYVSSYVLPALLEKCFESYGPFPVRLQAFPFGSLNTCVRNRDADICFQTLADADEELATTRLFEDSWVMVASPSHPIAGAWNGEARGVSLPVLVPPGEAEVRRLIGRWARTHDLELSIVMECTNVDALKAAALRRLGVAFLPEVSIVTELASGALVTLPYCGLPLARSIVLLYDAKRQLPHPALALLETAKNGAWSQVFSSERERTSVQSCDHPMVAAVA